MSGGVDSSVAAALLKKDGYNVTGVHMVCAGPPIGGGCENSEDRRDAMKVAVTLNIPFLTWDFRKEYKKDVYDYMIREYIEGRTPNPDVMCNKQVKFGVFLKKALEMGADYISTGHYARSAAEGYARELFSLHSAKDKSKDQSYFLWTLTQDQLKYCLFPIGNYLKMEVREFARKFNLSTSEKKDSQGLCFVGKINFLDFLKEKIPVHSGDILDFSGKKIGTHEGACFYTIGQRHGFGLGGRKNPVFVAEKNIATNTVVVTEEKNEVLYKKDVLLENANWIFGKSPKLPINCFVRIRYRQPLQKCLISLSKKNLLFVDFLVPQRAVSPGQSAVFYNNRGEMLGGGIIT